jgi:hypothetical protein
MGILFYNANGKNGADGAPGTSGTGFVWRGAWNGMYNYSINDVVSYLNNLYIYIGGMVMEFPPNAPPNSQLWALMLSGLSSDYQSYVLNFPPKQMIVGSITNSNGDLTIVVNNPTIYQKGWLMQTLNDYGDFSCSSPVKSVYANRIEFFCEQGNWSGTPPIAEDYIYCIWYQGTDELIITHPFDTECIDIILFLDTSGTGILYRKPNEEGLIYQNNQNLRSPFPIPTAFYSGKIILNINANTNQYTGSYTEIPGGPGGGGIIPVG